MRTNSWYFKLRALAYYPWPEEFGQGNGPGDEDEEQEYNNPAVSEAELAAVADAGNVAVQKAVNLLESWANLKALQEKSAIAHKAYDKKLKKLQEQLPEVLVTDGCIYIVGEIKEAGKILQSGDIFRIVYGVRNKEEFRPELETIKQDLEDAGIDVILSDNIQKDALQKFSFVSPMAACGAYYDVRVEEVQKEGEIRSTFIALIEEINAIAKAMNISLPENIVEINLEIMDQLAPNASASMQRDIWAGKESEIDGLVYEVVRLGKKYDVPTPMYDKVAKKFS